MPVIKSAIKKLRHDQKREAQNDASRKIVKDFVKKAAKKKTPSDIKKAISLVDKAVKNNLMHKNKAARIKSKLTKGTKPGPKKTTTKTAAPKPTQKTPIKKTASKPAKKTSIQK